MDSKRCLNCLSNYQKSEKYGKVRWEKSKFCSTKCSGIYRDKSTIKPLYRSLHNWIVRMLGKAKKCENKECSRKSKSYQWSLIRGRKYEKRLSNFRQLCASCHKRYDFKESTRKKMRLSRFGKKHTMKTRLKLSKIRKLLWAKGVYVK